MKTLKNYVLLIGALFLVSTVSYGQIVLASSKNKDKDKKAASTETVATSTTTPAEAKPAEEEPAAEEKTFTLSGSIDTYFHTSFGTKNIVSGFQPNAPTTSFANLKGFSLGMINLIAAYQGEKAGFVADVVIGPRGSDAVFNSGGYGNLKGAGSGHLVNQMYAYYKVSDAVTFNLGQFNTFVGFEVISPTINPNYSTSYLFSNGPFNHTGLRADFSFGDGMVAKLAVMNPTDILEFNPVNTYTIGAQIGKTSDAGGVYLNFLYGDQDGKLKDKTGPFLDSDGELNSSVGTLFQADLTLGYNLGEKFYLGFNTSYQSIAPGQVVTGNIVDGFEIEDAGGDATSFVGFAVYPKFIFSETASLAIRGEYFSVKKGHPLASPIATDDEGNGSVIELTLSGNIKAGPLTLIPEFRIDKMSEDFFLNKDEDDFTDMMGTFTFAAVYKF